MTGPWTPWETLRRQVALSGRVVSAATGTGVDDAEVRVVDGPRPVARIAERRPDGVYFFLDLPAGKYVVAGEDRGRRRHGTGTGDVSWDDKGNVHRAAVDIELKEVPRERAPAAATERSRPRKPRSPR